MQEAKFYRCKHCGNLIAMVNDSGVPVVCCGEPMTELVPGAVDAAVEKHLPVAERKGDLLTVSVGSVAHPMTAEHYIQWVCLQTDKGAQRKVLNPGDKPEVTFALGGDKPLVLFAYCNLHGLWRTQL